MPFLNFVEKCDQDLVVSIFPKLCIDLANQKNDTLADFKVEWTHVHVVKESIESELDQFLLGAM